MNSSSQLASNTYSNRSSLESHLISKHNYTYEQTTKIDIDQFPDVDLIKSSVKSSSSPSVATLAAVNNVIPKVSTQSNPQSFYSSFLQQQQQQQQQQQAQFPASLLQSALLQQQNSNTNGLNSMLITTLFNQIQQQQQLQLNTNKLDETPLDLSNSVAMSLLAAGNTSPASTLSALSSMAYKTMVKSDEQSKQSNQLNKTTNNENRSRSSSSGGGNVFDEKNKVNSSLNSNNKIPFTVSQKQHQQQQQQRRVRTQMTQYQVNVMRLIFAEYKTPTMNECEQMGREINLKKRVVQVWFQNARAKEKKNHPNNSRSILFSNTANNDLSNYEFSSDECIMCNVKYNHSLSTALATPGSNSQAQRVSFVQFI